MKSTKQFTLLKYDSYKTSLTLSLEKFV